MWMILALETARLCYLKKIIFESLIYVLYHIKFIVLSFYQGNGSMLTEFVYLLLLMRFVLCLMEVTGSASTAFKALFLVQC